MHIQEYTLAHSEVLQTAARKMASRNLRHQEFVNHYYASSEWCHLYLLFSKEEEVIGTIGVERMPFRYHDQNLTIGFGTNFYSLKQGAGGFLFRQWMRSCPLAISLGASQDAHRILRSQRWPYFEGVKFLCLNKPYEFYPEDASWKRAAKWVARHTLRRPIRQFASRIPEIITNRISISEEKRYSNDLLPRRSPFEFRFTPGTDYLTWRYNLDLASIRYRVFRIVADGRSAGYVVLNENEHRILVAQCDAEEPETLAWGVLMSLVKLAAADTAPRTVILTCSHPGMEEIYRSFGFVIEAGQPLALGSLRRDVGPPPESATSNWLINFDWGDNGALDLSMLGSA
jgi:hypothetical protein